MPRLSSIGPRLAPGLVQALARAAAIAALTAGLAACPDLQGSPGGGGEGEGEGEGRPTPADLDGDGIDNATDSDMDGDGVPNEADPDVDGDGTDNGDDDAPFGEGAGDAEGPWGDLDGDDIPNAFDNDDDGDGTPDGVIGDRDCEGDGTNEDENNDCDGFCISVEGGYQPCDDGAPPGSGLPDTDGDGTPDADSDDDDGDGIPDDQDDDPRGDDNPPPGEPVCQEETFEGGSALAPRILLVVDKSGSMNEQATGFAGSKWDATRSTLQSVVTGLDNDVEFGLMLYPNGDANNNVCREGNVRVDVELGSANDIVNRLDQTQPGGGTPTAPTLLEARDALQSLGADGGTRAVILATDGGPNCNESLDGDTCRCVSANSSDCEGNPGNCLDDTNAISAAQQMNAAGFPVFVVGIPGSENFSDVLNAMADAGGTALSGGRRFYDASSSQALSEAVEDIAIRLGACRFDLSIAPPPGSLEVTDCPGACD